MVNLIVNAVVRHVKLGSFQNFLAIFQQSNNRTFNDILKLIETHVSTNKLTLPDKLNLIKAPNPVQPTVPIHPTALGNAPGTQIVSHPLLPLASNQSIETAIINRNNNVRTVTPRNVPLPMPIGPPVMHGVKPMHSASVSVSRVVVTPKPQPKNV